MNENDARFLEGKVVLRTASATDAEAVSILLEISYSRLLGSSYDINTLDLALPYMVKAKPRLLASGTYYVAEIGPGALVGCGGWTSEEPGSGQIVEGEGHIRHFAVHPDWIKRGIGTALLARCIADARLVGIHKLHCFSTLNAEPFYRTSGFRTIDLIDVRMGPTITFPAVLMEREIL
jgi:GNAT superfamily N-acetyltransferase